MKKVIVKEFTVQPGDAERLRIGEKYSCFVDPETGRYYRPVDGFEVHGDDLSDRFIEISED